MFQIVCFLILTIPICANENTLNNSTYSTEWLAIIALAVIAFIFIFRSMRQIQKIKTLQKTLNKQQQETHQQLDELGEKHG